MAEMTKEEAKKDLQKMVGKSRAEIEKQKEAQMSAEEKKKADEAKVQAEQKRKEAEAQVAKDKEILAKKDEELSDEDKKRKSKLLDKQRKDEEAKLSSAEKIKRVKEETQKRIDEISNELKQVKDAGSKETETLQRELATLREEKVALEKKLSISPAEDETESILDEEERKRITKYLEEDKDKPREKRREMSQEELDDWLVEELGKAQVWLTRREFRREKEREKDRFSKRQEKYVKTLLNKQSESAKRAWVKHPELDVSKREAELKAEGKNPQEIHNILCKENEKHKVCCELLAKNPQRYMPVENGPELLVADMEEQLGKPAPTDEKQTQIDDLTKKVEDLTATIQQLQTSDEGINSTILRRPPEGELTEKEKLFVKTAKEMKLPQEKIDARLKQMRQEGK